MFFLGRGDVLYLHPIIVPLIPCPILRGYSQPVSFLMGVSPSSFQWEGVPCPELDGGTPAHHNWMGYPPVWTWLGYTPPPPHQDWMALGQVMLLAVRLLGLPTGGLSCWNWRSVMFQNLLRDMLDGWDSVMEPCPVPGSVRISHYKDTPFKDGWTNFMSLGLPLPPSTSFLPTFEWKSSWNVRIRCVWWYSQIIWKGSKWIELLFDDSCSLHPSKCTGEASWH